MTRRTLSLRPTSICAPTTATRPADGATAAGDYRANRSRKPGEVGFGHPWQVVFESHHIVAEQMPKRRVQGPPASGIEQRRYISECVARH